MVYTQSETSLLVVLGRRKAAGLVIQASQQQ